MSWQPLGTYSNVHTSRLVNEVAFVFLQLGQPDKADELLARSLERQLRFYGMGIRLPRQLKNHAVTLYLMGRRDQAMEKMNEAIDYGWCESVLMTNDPVMALLREDPRYREMEAAVIHHIENQRKRLERAGIGILHD